METALSVIYWGSLALQPFSVPPRPHYLGIQSSQVVLRRSVWQKSQLTELSSIDICPWFESASESRGSCRLLCKRLELIMWISQGFPQDGFWNGFGGQAGMDGGLLKSEIWVIENVRGGALLWQEPQYWKYDRKICTPPLRTCQTAQQIQWITMSYTFRIINDK